MRYDHAWFCPDCPYRYIASQAYAWIACPHCWQIMERLEKRGVLVHDVGPRRFRLVTHYWVGEGDIDTALGAFEAVLKGKR